MSTTKDHDQITELVVEEKSVEGQLIALQKQTQTNTDWITHFSDTWKYLGIGLGIAWTILTILISYLLTNHINLNRLFHVAKLH